MRVYSTETKNVIAKVYVKQRLNAVLFTDAPFEVSGLLSLSLALVLSLLYLPLVGPAAHLTAHCPVLQQAKEAAPEKAEQPERKKRAKENLLEMEPDDEDDDALWGSLGQVGDGAKRVKALVEEDDEPDVKPVKKGKKGKKAA